MSNIAVIAAAGNGERLNCCSSKMLARISGRPLLAYTLDAFEKSDRIDEIILVLRSQDQNTIEQEVLKKVQYRKLTSVVPGGVTRQESVYQGLKSIKKDHDLVVIHDGARPFVRGQMIEKSIDLIDSYDGVIIAVQVIETIKRASGPKIIVDETVNREEYWIVQTPQTFRLGYIKALYQRAEAEGLMVTDDAAIVEHYGGKIKIIPGSRENIKITTSVDLALAEVLSRKQYGTR